MAINYHVIDIVDMNNCEKFNQPFLRQHKCPICHGDICDHHFLIVIMNKGFAWLAHDYCVQKMKEVKNEKK